MNKAEVEKLLERYRNGLCTEDEQALVESWHLSELKAGISDLDHAELIDAKKQIWNAIEEETELKPVRKHTLWLKLAAAAVVLFFIGFVINNQLKRQLTDPQQIAKTTEKIIKPGGNKATLTLADGSKISLTDATNGVIAKQAGINITKTSNGELIYTVSAQSASNVKKDVYNTIETPRGGQYQINLPDGTKVWLNAESALKYPAVFNGDERKVELKGEAYFEVAKLTDKKGIRVPFKVKSDIGAGRSQEVEVLGTHFNINAYNNEPSNKTTLLEGSVRIKNLQSNISQLLRPGQQSVISPSLPSIKIENVDAEEAVTWKDGYFSFNEENLATIMNKIARWYNVEIDYRGNKINKTFGGRISRFNSVNEVLDMLETTGAVHFKIEERRILVMP
ncbi:FecR family protein [Pedobacter sp. UBA5917]|jgi:ferric-dicitrate binding protein FerR (iron transport regulator)|uniref:FecR family protein n=1 Tax=Pedobacter sp. UBA5917 TaxID=1947061 RepID=UPI0025E0B3F4|nr:FecR family protein [Pedobacter sp. UBA5917]